MEHIIKVTIINQLMGLEVNDYLHVGETTIVRTTDGYAVCDNGEEINVVEVWRALELAIENEEARLSRQEA